MKTAWILLLTLAMATSCTTTQALWDDTDPYVALSLSDITEDELKAQGIPYYRDDARQVFFVEKRGLAKYKDYAVRALGTPATIAIDAATTIVVVGAAAGVFVAWGVAQSGGCTYQK